MQVNILLRITLSIISSFLLLLLFSVGKTGHAPQCQPTQSRKNFMLPVQKIRSYSTPSSHQIWPKRARSQTSKKPSKQPSKQNFPTNRIKWNGMSKGNVLLLLFLLKNLPQEYPSCAWFCALIVSWTECYALILILCILLVAWDIYLGEVTGIECLTSPFA